MGLTLADGYWIAARLERHRLGHHIPIDETRLGALSSSMFCLPRLFCLDSQGTPHPDDIAQRLDEMDRLIRSREEEPVRRRRPRAAEGVPSQIAALMDARKWDMDDTETAGPEIARSTVIFVSQE